MFVAPFVVGLVFIILTLASPILSKFTFKIEKFNGLLLGIITSLITCVSLGVIITVSIIIIKILISKDVENGGMEILINSLNDVTELEKLSFLTLFIVWVAMTLTFALIFIILFFLIKRISKPEDDSIIIFMFCSGYILIPSLFWNIFCILLCFEINMFGSLTGGIFDIFNSFFILLIEFGGLFCVLLIVGTSIMINLHHKEYNSLIIWICIAIYFAPIIFYLLGFILIKAFFFSFLNGACPLLSIVCGCFLYYKYASNQGGASSALLGSHVEMAS